jgi:hypothetical protein
MSRSKASKEEKAWQIGDQEIGARNRARRIAGELREEAAGKSCGGCKHAVVMSHGGGFCGLHLNMMTGNAIAIYRFDAPACRQWKPKAK